MLSVKVTVEVIDLRPGESSGYEIITHQTSGESDDPLGDALVEAGERTRDAIKSGVCACGPEDGCQRCA